MLPVNDIRRVYDPDTLKTIADAFESAWRRLPAEVKGGAGARRKLALLVMRHVGRGELDPTHLGDLALCDFRR